MKTSKSLIKLAIPAVIQSLAGTLMQYVDTAMVGHLGEEATVAVSTTTPINWLLGSVAYSLGIGALAVISKSLGAKDYEKIKRASQSGFILTLVFGGLITLITLSLSSKVPVWMNTAKNVQRDASIYFFIVSASILFRTMTATFGSMLSAVKNTRTPMIINISSNVLNAILNYVLIYCFSLGTFGAGVATSIAHILCGIAMMIVYFRNIYLRFNIFEIKFDKEITREITTLSLPVLLKNVATTSAHVCFASLVNSMGTVVYAAHSIALCAEEIFYVSGFGLRTATSTLVGISLGEKNEKGFKEVRNLSLLYTLVMMVISGVVLFLSADVLMRFFTNSERVVVLGAKVLRMVAVTEPFFGIMIAWEGVFFGLGKPRPVFFNEIICIWGIRVLSTFIAVKYFNPTLDIIWCFMIADNVIKAVLLSLMGRGLSIEKT